MPLFVLAEGLEGVSPLAEPFRDDRETDRRARIPRRWLGEQTAAIPRFAHPHCYDDNVIRLDVPTRRPGKTFAMARCWASDMPAKSKIRPNRPRPPRALSAGYRAFRGPPQRGRREVVVVDLEQVDAVVLKTTFPASRVGDPLVHPGRLDDTFAYIAVEEAGVAMYPVSKRPVSVTTHANPFGSGSARPMNAKASSSPLRFVP